MPIDGLAILTDGWLVTPSAAGTVHNIVLEDDVFVLENDNG